METDAGDKASYLNALDKKLKNFDFFQTVWYLDQIFSDMNNLNQTAYSHHLQPSQEWIRFKHKLDLAFSVSTLDRYDFQNSTLWLNWFGIVGYNSLLPNYYAEILFEQAYNKNILAQEFLNLFYHRLMTLFYFSWEKYRVYFSFARSKRVKSLINPLDFMLGSLIGCTNYQDKSIPSMDRLFFYSGLLSRNIRSAEQLNKILTDYFGITISIIPFQGRWISLTDLEASKIGTNPLKSNINTSNCWYNQLGVNCCIGKRIWFLQNNCLIQIGPLPYKNYLSWLPEGILYSDLKKILSFCLGIEINYKIQLILLNTEVPNFQLRQNNPQKLGWNTWLKINNFSNHANDLIMSTH